MTWTHQGTDDYRAATSGQTSWTVSAGTVGDLRVIRFQLVAGSISVSSLSGGGVSTWTRAGSSNVSNASSTIYGQAGRVEYWYGPITGTGTALTISYSGSIGSNSVRTLRADFRCSSALTNLTVENTGFTDQTSNATTVTFPSTSSGATGTQLAVGFALVGGTASAGSTSGYTYSIDSNGNVNLYNLAVAPSTAQQPTAPQTSAPYSAELVIFSNNPVANPTAGTVTAAGQGPSHTVTTGPSSATVTAAGQAPSMTLTAPAGEGAAVAAGFSPTTIAGPLAGAGAATAAGQGAGQTLTSAAGEAVAVAAAFNAIGRPGVKPAGRVTSVPAEDRVFRVPAESRVFGVPADVRTYKVPKE